MAEALQTAVVEDAAPRALVFDARRRLRDALALVPSRNATTDGVQRAAALALQVAELLQEEVEARARDTAQRRAGYDPDAILLDKLGRVRSPATIPGYMAGRPAPSRGRRYPPSPLTLEDITSALGAVDQVSKNDAYAKRLRAITFIFWRTGLRCAEALALAEGDLSRKSGEVFVRRGKGGRSRQIGIDDWVWEEALDPWLQLRAELEPGPVFCVIEGRTAGLDAWGASQVREKFSDLQAAAGLRKRFRPHQLRHRLTIELMEEGFPMPYIQRILGHAHLGVTDTYTRSLSNEKVIEAMRGRPMPMRPAFGGRS